MRYDNSSSSHIGLNICGIGQLFLSVFFNLDFGVLTHEQLLNLKNSRVIGEFDSGSESIFIKDFVFFFKELVFIFQKISWVFIVMGEDPQVLEVFFFLTSICFLDGISEEKEFTGILDLKSKDNKGVMRLVVGEEMIRSAITNIPSCGVHMGVCSLFFLFIFINT
jgi:hypothetical protein